MEQEKIMKLIERELPDRKVILYASYDDRIGNEELSGIAEKDDPEQEFDETVMQLWDDAAEYCIREAAENMLPELDGADLQDVMDMIRENTEVEYPFDHYRRQEYNVPVMLDTGDMNYDFTLNDIAPWSEPDERASIVWLVKQQGHTVDELKAVMEGSLPDSVAFISGVQQEIENCTSSMSTLTFLVRMTAGDIIRINKEMKKESPEGYVRLKRTTACGLFAPWTGAGSTLGIELEKDVVVPVADIWSCAPDIPKGRGWWYGVDETYGLTGKTWARGGIEEICI